MLFLTRYLHTVSEQDYQSHLLLSGTLIALLLSLNRLRGLDCTKANPAPSIRIA
ncbi:hypothetical protein BOCO_0237 [Bombiscardovia coagulans]|uniref:Uncharacterized protein n=1 Tax=Bombiscardovia coagulans TaxID=686666 RepID=A0A261EUX9_9BIFI|nr:hypothetical protein BOCO_0237 [Bombiscardovia coagulans]